MKAEKEKITTRQLMLLFIVSTFSPATRAFPTFTAKIAKEAGWLSPIVAFAGMVILVIVVQSFFKKDKSLNLSDVIYNILGKIIGRVIVSVYFVWILLLLAFYVRNYAERILTLILPNTTMNFFTITMLLLVFFVVRGGIVSLVRLNEVLFLGITIAFGITTILSFSNFDITNILPVSYKDILPITKAGYIIYAIWGIFLFMFFFADKVSDKERIKRLGIRSAFFLLCVSTALIAVTIGGLGQSLTTRISVPYFVTIKNISILNILERFESVILSIWVAADFVIISTLMYILVSIMKSLFKLSGTKSFVSPLTLITYFLTIGIAKNHFELESFLEYIVLPFSVILEFAAPIVLFAIGKVRKVI